MDIHNTQSTYGTVAKFLHWLIALAVICMLTVGFIMDDIADKAFKKEVYALHKATGITILVLMLLRILWAFTNPRPGYSINLPNWQRLAAKSVHWLFYLALIAMPLSGWYMATAAGHAPSIFGWFTLPMPGVAESKALAKVGGKIHEILAYTIITLLVMHIGAALKHHFINKDNVLRRMLPFS